MKCCDIVIGSAFGDEGKGLFTSFLSGRFKNGLVIRFNGGHQAGHTVVLDDKIRHIFSNFGSGTLRGVPTYWSKFCTIDPIGIYNETESLKNIESVPTLYIDRNCPVTTPYEKLFNFLKEELNNHGSTGQGFGATVKREEDHYSLLFKDLFYEDILKEKLKNIRTYYGYGITILEEKINEFLEKCKWLISNRNIRVVDSLNDVYFDKYDNFIFEGAQGLLLDQNYGFFPNVTRSNTGTKNVLSLLSNLKDEYIINSVNLITRAYQTRHGNGFMTNENLIHNIKENKSETNVENKYQGKFRRSLLDLSLLEYAYKSDDYIYHNKNLINLCITCLDHVVDEYRFTYKNEIYQFSGEKDFINKISNILGINNIYVSKSSISEKIYYHLIDN